MKFSVSVISLVFGSKSPCRMGASSRQQCQMLCDATSYCDAWSYNDSIQTCWMKQRHGWSATADEAFDSGFRNNAPFYQKGTNFDGGDYTCEIFHSSCRVKTANNAECQNLCDITDYCFAWSRHHGTSEMCQFKTLDGWVSEQNSAYDSGFKNQGPLVETNTRLNAVDNNGNYVCDLQNPVH